MNELKFDANGLIPVVAQDRLTGQVRMVAWMNQDAVKRTLESGFATFFSRSRQSLWQKGETSGNRLRVHQLVADCDADTLIALVDPEGPSCHTGRDSCFFAPVDDAAGPRVEEERDRGVAPILFDLESEIAERATSSATKSYTRHLLDGGVEKITEKVREEAGELCEALSSETDERVASEAGDLIYHLMVGLRARGISLRSVMEVLASRQGTSGHAEKASRSARVESGSQDRPAQEKG